ncbi:HIT family protein [Devosia neptuniae]|jgi:diadenosine tetraphosphate (Ap4A) HIT family hydrolase|uniref:HIT family protein n=2 Tax=Devosia TaxID=46913 RepID=UPI0022AE9246|nr:HIT family protein [Devosia neptuniae]MCZ4346550.1 HIT family protein [Devosia neptuniae]|tara:strand:+ start:10489 stop:10983 length:495 start_codon:yes stop_codon:yes gene_type:complete
MRLPFDLDAHVQRSQHGPCFICELVAGNPDYGHHVIDRDDDTIIFLSKFPTLPGYALVCPTRHYEDLAEDMSPQAYLALQAVVHRLSRALKSVYDAERIYVLSLGSKQGNSHLHWHVVPLPKGVPYDQQQYHALMAEHGVLEFSDAEMAKAAANIAAAYYALAD